MPKPIYIKEIVDEVIKEIEEKCKTNQKTPKKKLRD